MIPTKSPQSESGFALLITIIVVGVLISIGLSILDLSTKQIRLSTNAKDSEIAFHAAYAGAECGRYWKKAASTTMETGLAITPTCFGTSPDSGSNTVSTITTGISGDGGAYLYRYDFTWGAVGSQKCTQVTTLVASSTALGAGLVIDNMTTLVPGYAAGNTKTCAAGERCTVLSSRGYNKPCSTVTGASAYGTVQREVLLQF